MVKFKIAHKSNMSHNCLVHLVAPYIKIILNVVGLLDLETIAAHFLTGIVIAEDFEWWMLFIGFCIIGKWGLSWYAKIILVLNLVGCCIYNFVCCHNSLGQHHTFYVTASWTEAHAVLVTNGAFSILVN